MNDHEKTTRSTDHKAGSAPYSGEELKFHRLVRLLPGNQETPLAKEILADDQFLEGLSSHQLLRAAQVAMEHGLIDRGLEIFTQLNAKFPDVGQGWEEHADVLNLLGRKKELLSLVFRAKKHLDKEKIHALTRRNPDRQERPVEIEPDHETDITTGMNPPISLEEGELFGNELAPFKENRQRSRNLSAFMAIFRGREDVFARQWLDRSKGIAGYSPVKRPMNITDIEDHLKGTRSYGIYLMNPDNTVRIGVIDIDLHKDYRKPGSLKGLGGALKREVRFILGTIKDAATRAGLSCIGEFSGGKGYHLWFPVKAPVPAASMRTALAALCRNVTGKTEFFQLEIFPKQDRLSGKGLGNLVKLPLGIHRLTGKRSFLVMAGTRDRDRQLSIIASLEPSQPETITALASEAEKAEVVMHPAVSKLKENFPMLAELQQGCRVISSLVTTCLSGRDPGERGRKILLSTIGHLQQGRQMLHHILSKTPDYNRPLLDYEISRLRGTPLGCRRIHSLSGLGEGGLDCAFHLEKGQYAHPLLHIPGWKNDVTGTRAERIENLKDALLNLKTAVKIVERFL